VSLTLPPVPVTVVTGFLGVGKTTAILDLLASGAAGARPAVLVNDFGVIGVDAARMRLDGVEVREVAGGCICCAAALPLRVALVRLLREVRPDRLIIEPSGLARADGVLDVLRSPGLAAAVDVRATITIVDPARFPATDPDIAEIEAAQVQAGDVLVVNRSDLAAPEGVARGLAARFPRPRVVAITERGRLHPGWLSLPARGAPPAPPEVVDLRTGVQVDPPGVPASWAAWGRPARVPTAVWTEAVHQAVAVRGVRALRAAGWADRGWMQVEAGPTRASWFPVAYRGDAVVEVDGDASLDRAALDGCFAFLGGDGDGAGRSVPARGV
jgi:Ni2+-binding GTPase involved in maturation of urease and hydrogenase